MSDYKLKKDLNFLKIMIEEFFSKKQLKDKLKKFPALELSGWEIWLQVEFLLFLSENERVAEVYREQRCALDGRKSKFKYDCAIDFLIREKNAQSYIPLEIKQNRSAAQCIRNMKKDIEKYERIKKSDSYTDRSVWCLGIHKSVQRDYLEDLIEFDPNYMFIYEIKGTEYTVTLF